MDLKKIYSESLEDLFKANLTVEALEAKIGAMVRDKTFEKYRAKSIFYDEMEFELIGVKARVETNCCFTNSKCVFLRLIYFCKSKLPKAKMERLNEAKKIFLQTGDLQNNNCKAPTWKMLRFYLDLDEVFMEEINVNIPLVFLQ